jgi:hypothetical protein
LLIGNHHSKELAYINTAKIGLRSETKATRVFFEILHFSCGLYWELGWTSWIRDNSTPRLFLKKAGYITDKNIHTTQKLSGSKHGIVETFAGNEDSDECQH